jgi:hypothetical protein
MITTEQATKIRYSSKNPNYLTTLNLPYQCDYLGIKMLR